jgi:hypothetical protein
MRDESKDTIYVGARDRCGSAYYRRAGAWYECCGCGDLVSGANPQPINKIAERTPAHEPDEN